MAETKKYVSQFAYGEDIYVIKDAEARQSITELQNSVTGAMHYIGVSQTALTDGITTNPIRIDGKDVSAVSGDVVIYGELEYVYNGSKWQEFGSTGSLKALAFKDSASATYTPEGNNTASAVTLEGGSTSKLVTTTITGVAGTVTLNEKPTLNTQNITTVGGTVTVHDTPTLNTSALRGVKTDTTTTHDTPTLNTSSIGSASGWSAGTMFSMEYTENSETLTFTQGVAPSLTITNTDVGTSLTAGSEVVVPIADESATNVGTSLTDGTAQTVATAATDQVAVGISLTDGSEVTVATSSSSATTVATGAVNSEGEGATVATALHTGGTAAAQVFTGTQDTIVVS